MVVPEEGKRGRGEEGTKRGEEGDKHFAFRAKPPIGSVPFD